MDDGEKLIKNSNDTADWYSIQLKNADIDKEQCEEFICDTITISSNQSAFSFNDCINSRIGNGSFGIVYRGEESKTGKPVAIKKMQNISVRLDELKVMQAIKSDYLVGITDNCMINNDHDCFYIIMELCDIDLDRHLKYHSTNGTLSEQNFTRLMDNVIRGYNELYNCCIVHRDIKPQNILIKYKEPNLIEIVKISDFGISRILSDKEEKSLSNVAGTLHYMAPEVGANILRAHEYGHEVDIWSIGCVFYQCIMGKVPFNEQELCRMFLFAACENYEAYNKPILSLDIDEIVARIISSQLEIDSTKRTTPCQLYDEICK